MYKSIIMKKPDQFQTRIMLSGNMKGGVGKSSSTLIIASELTLNYFKKIIVLDCDEQSTISKTRSMDAQLFPKWAAPYEIEKTPLKNVIQRIKELKSKNEHHFIIIDMPRITEDMNNPSISFDIVQLLAVVDFLFIPFIAETMALQTTSDFMQYVNDVKQWKDEKGYPFKYIGFHNRWKNAAENKDIPDWANHINLPLMKNHLNDSTLISRHYSSYFSLTQRKGGKEIIKPFMDELVQFLNN
ncbi:cellulose biosynthesis protein BcsQ [Pedobacter nutrimenti]|uniref:Cellulose biosynthesis protein BcsQ n=2 Tax=Pedobacter nutrimenti TaxID=1241337 RepID=A0A318U6I3_9SPHI|nr:cellulose biosynthesis protein BcsQ [Pedobacter nutrimenti]